MEKTNYTQPYLYVLKMNDWGTETFIERYELSEFPELNEWFNNTQARGQIEDYQKEWNLLERNVGSERIVNYGTESSRLTWEMIQSNKSLREYAESVEKTKRILTRTGLAEIRHEQNKANLDYCCFSDTFYVYGAPFLKLIYRLGHRVKTDPIMTEYDLPNWQIEFFHTGGLYVRKRKEILPEKKAFDEWLQFIIKEPDDVTSCKIEIQKQIGRTLSTSIHIDDILYDFASDCYLLKDEIEQVVIRELMPERDMDTEEIAKYTTFETLVAILQSGKVRMNSLVSMNDKTEADFLKDAIKNYKEDYEQDHDKYLFADKKFITSFTKRIDELDMWRLYGDNARGVCMVFERMDKVNDGLHKIRYIHPDGDSLKGVFDLMEALKAKDIRFRLNLLQKLRHFLKHLDYVAEDECRLLINSDKPDGWFVNRDNGILTPYIEKSITQERQNMDGNYPFRLSKIILGPAISEKYANLMQVFYLAHQYGYYLSVQESAIDSYR